MTQQRKRRIGIATPEEIKEKNKRDRERFTTQRSRKNRRSLEKALLNR